ncbi:hypothetical protein SmJEL517_g03877 [Synchytrium microbalum]|uniref:Secreted protein n=1 Tax=Synchytrium microbalum TaxID=1806994 RepID=A0A507C195_9FUNG|nr:uncharacterized protein SmJEL517_g03877 [Synchytrium microbalum]TPX33191.1 hypothetical protein SmJEL517_g03877 [Synchytrium microbalum]
MTLSSICIIILVVLVGRSSAQNCQLTVPANPLTAQGLATPYLLSGDATCKQATIPSFVEATIVDTKTGALSVYNPLVIDINTKPGIPPVVPNLATGAVVGIWFGTNAATITLINPVGVNAIGQGLCVNGIPGSIFGQFAACNAPAMFAAATAAKVAIPPLGVGLNKLPCYTTRSFQIVDMDPSDNVVASYLVLANGLIAQSTAVNKKANANATEINNGSDNLLLDVAMRPALNCTAFVAPDLTNPGFMKGSLALNELQAAKLQAAPIARVPPADPMCLANGALNATKLNLYRASVNQPATAAKNLTALTAVDTKFCKNFLATGASSIKTDKPFTMGKPSPAPAVAIDLFTFLAQRFAISFGAGGLNCIGLLNMTTPPIVPVMDGKGVTVNVTFKI